MSSVKLSDLITRIRQASDQTSSTGTTNFITDAEITNYINSGVSELYDILANAFEDYFTKKTTLSLVVNQENYTLPNDFYKLVKLFYLDGTDRYVLRRFDLDQYDLYNNSSSLTIDSGKYLKYRLFGNQIYFAPTPASVATIEMWYIPAVAKLNYAGDMIHINIPIGWEEYVIADGAAKCLAKEESDPNFQIMQKQAIEQRIKRFAKERDGSDQDTVVDYYRRFTN